jgi:hypothetical protein
MRRFIMRALVVGVVFGVALAAQRREPDVAANSDRTLLEVDRALAQAIGKADNAAVGTLLDENFTWTDRTGRIRNKAQVLEDLTIPPDSKSDSDTHVRVRDYSQLGIVTGIHRISAQNADVSFLRIWVKRKAGWRAFLYQGTTIAAQAPAQEAAAGSGGAGSSDCKNPCKFAPFEPKTEAAQQVIAAWQAVENAVKDPDPDIWTKYIGDEFEFVPKEDGHPINKAERIATLKKQKQTGTRTPIGEAELMHVWVFGNTAVQVGNQLTPAGSVPYHCTRVWIKRDGRWQLVFSQQTTVKQSIVATR